MKHHHGRLEVITGPMFCGKTDELLRRLRRAIIAKQKSRYLSRDLISATAMRRSPLMLGMSMMLLL